MSRNLTHKDVCVLDNVRLTVQYTFRMLMYKLIVRAVTRCFTFIRSRSWLHFMLHCLVSDLQQMNEATDTCNQPVSSSEAKRECSFQTAT